MIAKRRLVRIVAQVRALEHPLRLQLLEVLAATTRTIGGRVRRAGAYPAKHPLRSPHMCEQCRLTTPRGAHDLCHACAIRLRADVRRGLDAIEDYLGAWSSLEDWLAEQDG